MGAPFPIQSRGALGCGRWIRRARDDSDHTFVLVSTATRASRLTCIEVGKPQANATFSPHGGTAFVSVTGANAVADIHMASLAAVGRIPTGVAPMSLVLLDRAAELPTPRQPGGRTGGRSGRTVADG